jgi:hypothetical protein
MAPSRTPFSGPQIRLIALPWVSPSFHTFVIILARFLKIIVVKSDISNCHKCYCCFISIPRWNARGRGLFEGTVLVLNWRTWGKSLPLWLWLSVLRNRLELATFRMYVRFLMSAAYVPLLSLLPCDHVSALVYPTLCIISNMSANSWTLFQSYACVFSFYFTNSSLSPFGAT